MTGEIADGWLPIFYSPERERLLTDELDAGLAQAGRSVEDIDVAATVMVVSGDDVAACRDQLRPMIALYIGGMGAKHKNFYHLLAMRYGFEEAADRIQEAYLDGRRDEAAGLVPDDLIDEVALVGPMDRIIDRLGAWQASRVTTMILGTTQPEVLEGIAEHL